MKKQVLCLLFLASCATKISNFEKYEKAPLVQVENMPTKEQLAISLPRVMLSSKQPTAELALKSNAHDVVKSDLITLLETEKFASVTERPADKNLEKEIALAEMEGKSVNIKSVDYLLDVTINNLTFSNSFRRIPATQYRPSRSEYRYTSVVDGIIKIYEIPSMKILKVISLKGDAVKDEEVLSGGGLKIGNFSIGGEQSKPKDFDSEIAYMAIKDAVKNAKPELRSFIKKKAYILEKRVLKNDAIYAINRGSENGVKSQDKLSVVRQQTETNALTGESESVNQNICMGIVAKNTISENRAWAVFEKSCNEKIRLGDTVDFIYKKK